MSILVRHSLLFMFLAALLGFLFPEASLNVFPWLPYVLFSLMAMTLLGMDQRVLVRALRRGAVWRYAIGHSFGYMLLGYAATSLFDAEPALVLAVVAVGATGSLFATPAIVRALELDALLAMAMTIATTLLLPIALFPALMWLQPEGARLDMVEYLLRLVVFIFGPMLLSYLVHSLAPREKLNRLLLKVSPYTIVLVFAFPFGLIGHFRLMWDDNALTAASYFLIATVIVAVFFCIAFFVYRRQGNEHALMAAITAGNRNVLLTYSIAGVVLGPAFLPLAGAIQAPTYLLPLVTRWLAKRLQSKSH